MGVTLKQKVLQSATTGSANSTFVTTADILVGEDIFIAMGRTMLAGDTAGILNITTSAGAGTFERVATSSRSATFDVHIGRLRCTTLIPSGSTITAVARDAVGKRGGVMQVVSGLKATYTAANASSGNAADNTSNINAGVNGTGTTQTVSTSAATTVANTFVIAGLSYGGTGTYTVTNGTEIDRIRTTSGSADRGAIMAYKIESTTGVKTIAATQPSGGWASTIAAFEIEPDPPPSGRTDEFTANSGSATSLAIPVDAAVAVGDLVVVSFAAALVSGNYAITDSRGNSYTVDDGPADFGIGSTLFGFARQGASKLTTALQSGDTITITCTGGTPNRWAAIAGVFNLPDNAVFGDVAAIETDSSVNHAVPPVTTVRNDALIVVSHYMVNSGRTVSPQSTWNLSAKVVSPVGSGDRAVVQGWKYIDDPAGPFGENMILYDSSGTSGAIAQVFEIPAPALIFKEWNGTSWVTLTSKEKTATVWSTVNPMEL